MFEGQHDTVTTQSALPCGEVVVDRLSSRRSTRAVADARATATRFLVAERTRSEREALAVACLRLVLSAYEDADTSHYVHAYEIAERRLDRRWAVDYVRTVSSIARALRRHRGTGFCFLRDMHDLLTPDEHIFLQGLQAAIDSNPVGVEAAALTLMQTACARGVAEDFRRLAKLTLFSKWLQRASV